MATSGQISGRKTFHDSVSGVEIDITLSWNRTDYSVLNNTSTINWTLLIENKNFTSGFRISKFTVTFDDTPVTVSLDNELVMPRSNYSYSSSQVIAHNTDGTKTFDYGCSITDNSYTNTQSLSGTGELDTINRKATIKTAQDIADIYDTLGNALITFNNPLGVNAKLEAAIVSNGYVIVPYREIANDVTSYRFIFTDEETKALRQSVETGSTSNIRYYIRTTIGNDTYEHSMGRTYTLYNHKPIFDMPVVYDVNQTTQTLTGDDYTVIKYHSNLFVQANATAVKEATLTSQLIKVGAKHSTADEAYFYNVEDNEVVLEATDSRGNTSTKTIALNFINYIHPTCNLTVDTVSSIGETTITIKGNAFYGSFGAVNNQINVYWRGKTKEGAYGNWSKVTAVLEDNNTYSCSFVLSGLDYTETYTFEAKTEDALEEVVSSEVKVSSIPIFDWSGTDFNFNIPVNFTKGFTQPNSALKVLKNGTFRLESASSAIILSEPISAQATGIVLIFTPYNPTTGATDDTKAMSFFVSKKTVEYARATNLGSNPLYTFFLMDKADFSAIGAKSLYIGDERIAGYSTNVASGTKNGITYDNNKFVLRSVLGV